MCRLGSGIFTIKKQICFSDVSDSHSEIIKEFNINDNVYSGKEKEFIKFEILPMVSLQSPNPEDWEFKIDEDISPTWYIADKDNIIKTAKSKLMRLIKNGRYSGHWEGDADFRDSKVDNLGTLTSIGGNAYFGGNDKLRKQWDEKKYNKGDK